MSLIEQIQKGQELIMRGRSYGKDTNALEAEVKSLQQRLETEIEQLKLSEFSRRDMAVEVHSSVLGGTVWFCSDKEMAAQIKRENPEAVCYTPAELRHLLSLNPSPEDLKRLHDAKTVFPGSSIAEGIPTN